MGVCALHVTKSANIQKKCNDISNNAVKPKIAWGVKTMAPINSIVIHTPKASELTPRKKTTICQTFNCEDLRPLHIAVEYKNKASVNKPVAIIISVGMM